MLTIAFRFRSLWRVAGVACFLLTVGFGSADTAQSILNPCQSKIDGARTKIRIMQNVANDAYATDRKRCGTNLACMKRAREKAAERSRAIQLEQTRLTQEIRDCQAEAKREQRSRENRTARDLGDPNTGTGGNTEMRPDQSSANPPNTRSGGNSRYRVRQPARQPRTRTYQRRQTYPTTPDGDWDPGKSTTQPKYPNTKDGDWDPRNSTTKPGNRTKDGDWVPPNNACQGLIDYSRERIKKMQNAANADYAADRINCGRDLACMNRAKETAAQRSRAINTEQARLAGEIRDCEKRHSAR